jgi:hypothetical protein
VYAAPAAIPAELIPDLFRITPREAGRWIADHHVLVLVESWHDDSEWRVVLA